jgi:hypothetical protein
MVLFKILNKSEKMENLQEESTSGVEGVRMGAMERIPLCKGSHTIPAAAFRMTSYFTIPDDNVLPKVRLE